MLKRTQLESRPLGHAKIKKPPSKAWGLFYFDAPRVLLRLGSTPSMVGHVRRAAKSRHQAPEVGSF